MLSMGSSPNTIQDFRGLPQLQPPPRAPSSQSPTIHTSPGPRTLPPNHPPAVNPFPGSIRRVPYRLSEGRTTADTHHNISAGGSVRMTARQPLNPIPLGFYDIHPTAQSSENRRNFPDYFDGLIETNSNRPSRVGAGVLQGNQSAPLPFIRPRLPRPHSSSSVGTASDSGLLTFRMEPSGQSAVVIRHSEGLFQPGQVVRYQAEFALCFESKMCPICQEEWNWKIFTPAEMALLDPSGAEWEVARLPCGHVFHGACLAVWFHEISVVNPRA